MLTASCGGVAVDGVVICTLMLGTGAGSGFLLCIADPRLELADGGGDFSRGDIGHCGVLSPDPPPVLCARGNFDTASDTDPCNCGTLAADSARWIAAAEGTEGCRDGLLSFRPGELFREESGLAPADGDFNGNRLFEGCFRSCGMGVVEEDCERTALGLRRAAAVFAFPGVGVGAAPGSAVSSWPLMDLKSAALLAMIA